MSAPFRIVKPDYDAQPAGRKSHSSEQDFKFYLERLLKMIPGEVIGFI